MKPELREVKSRKELRTFIYLPKKIHRDDPGWLPPIWMDEWELFDKEKNHSFQHADTLVLLAWHGNEAVGRVMGIISHRYNEIHNEKNGRFCFLECFNDQEVFHAMITAVEEWAREKGMTAIVGPLGFSDKDPQGFQIEGFDMPKIMTTVTNLPYLPEMLVKEGYTKKKDMVEYRAAIAGKLPDFYQKILERVAARKDLKVIEFKKRKEIEPYILSVLGLMNDTFVDIYGFVPLSDTEKIDLAKRYLSLLSPDFIKVIANDKEQLVGFVVAMPDLSPGIKKSRGYLFPFGILHILRASATSKTLQMVLGGVRADYRGQGIDTLMGAKILEAAIHRKMTTIDSHLILEDNMPMRGEMERINGKVIKRFRIFTKDL
jgi:GNAT superfamily N-acetyltransferase